MLDFKQKNKFRRILYAKPTILLLLFVFAFLADGAWTMYQKSQLASDNMRESEKQLAELEKRERELAEEIVDLSTERGIDEKIRERFMVAKDGENVIILADPEVEKIHTITVTDSEAEN